MKFFTETIPSISLFRWKINIESSKPSLIKESRVQTVIVYELMVLFEHAQVLNSSKSLGFCASLRVCIEKRYFNSRHFFHSIEFDRLFTPVCYIEVYEKE